MHAATSTRDCNPREYFIAIIEGAPPEVGGDVVIGEVVIIAGSGVGSTVVGTILGSAVG